MSNIVIEKDVAMPEHCSRTKYPWTKMEVGDSFFIPKLTISLGATNERYKPKKFIARKDGEGYRVWRIA